MTDLDNLAFDGQGRLLDVTEATEPGPPPDLTWTRLELMALTWTSVFGALVSVSDRRGLEHNLVVVSEMFTDEGGVWMRVVPYSAFVRWSQTAPEDRRPVPAPARAVLVKYLWVSHERRPGSGSGAGSASGGGSTLATGPLPLS